MGQTLEEKLQAVQERIKELKMREQIYKARIKEKDQKGGPQTKEQLYKAKLKEKTQKERMQRLVQIGTILASVGIDTVEKAEELKQQLDQITSASAGKP